MNASTEGFQYTPERGLQPGLPTLGAIQPQESINQQSYDVVIIGAGYAGLTAARDLTTSGLKVLLIEARDRIGGRAWSSNLGDYPFELGGTWVHWNQPHVYREISRYNLQEDLENSHDLSKGVNSFMLHTGGQTTKYSRAQEAELSNSALRKLVDVDGAFGRKTIPMPGAANINTQLGKYDNMSIADRLQQVTLSAAELAVIEGFLAITCGAKLEDASFGELLRWWALNNYDMQLFMEQCLTHKLRSGQSNFARKFFDEAQATRNLDHIFCAPITSVQDSEDSVLVRTSTSGYQAKQVICTIPLNVLKDVEFSPALDPVKLHASKQGHVNQVSKVHVEAANPELRSLSSTIARPFDKLTYTFGDGTTPAGNTHLVAFGSSYEGVHLQGEEDINDTVRALQRFAPEMDVKRVVFHNWSRDPYAQGAWEWLRPGMIAGREILDGLRKRQGKVHFANADWSFLWRGFIDGAIEDGARVAFDVRKEILGW